MQWSSIWNMSYCSLSSLTRATSVPQLQKMCECDFIFFIILLSLCIICWPPDHVAVVILHFLATIFHRKVWRHLHLNASLLFMLTFTLEWYLYWFNLMTTNCKMLKLWLEKTDKHESSWQFLKRPGQTLILNNVVTGYCESEENHSYSCGSFFLNVLSGTQLNSLVVTNCC